MVTTRKTLEPHPPIKAGQLSKVSPLVSPSRRRGKVTRVEVNPLPARDHCRSPRAPPLGQIGHPHSRGLGQPASSVGLRGGPVAGWPKCVQPSSAVNPSRSSGKLAVAAVYDADDQFFIPPRFHLSREALPDAC